MKHSYRWIATAFALLYSTRTLADTTFSGVSINGTLSAFSSYQTLPHEIDFDLNAVVGPGSGCSGNIVTVYSAFDRVPIAFIDLSLQGVVTSGSTLFINLVVEDLQFSSVIGTHNELLNQPADMPYAQRVILQPNSGLIKVKVSLFLNGCLVVIADESVHVIGTPCDVNCDGTVNPFDIQPFLDLLQEINPDPCIYYSGDLNGDGTVNPFDIQPYLNCLNSP